MAKEHMLACCGIDCATCDIYIAAQDPEAAQRLAEKWQANGTADAKPEWFRCQGCFEDRTLCWSDDCGIYSCCSEKNLSNCSQCADFPCEQYRAWIGPYPHHQAACERLLAMQAGEVPG